MRAAYIEQLGSPDVIRYGDQPTPEPGPTDVLVDVTAVSVNHVDTFVRSGAWRTPLTFPFVIGRDLTGTVAAVGPRVHRVRPGAPGGGKINGHPRRAGGPAERGVVPLDRRS
ncbi:alcohol dehydrogenase catalytic domain-containing protein, partial [Streptomyces albogriseolus]|uniref:alcohol dehydrogenase catalytic domain-containing protein n=1 Tax=Streptomyces albogriseolus TaxID=1887 RepID=UPI0036952D86